MTAPGSPVTPRGDEEALFRQHHPRVVANVRRHVTAPEEVIEDACQTAWLQLLRTQPDREHVVGWLTVTAQREAVRIRRKDCREATLNTDQGPHGLLEHAAPAWDDTATINAHRALEALADLRPRQRQVLELAVGGFDYHEIAALTATSYTSVNRHLTRARAALREVRDQEAAA